MFTFAPCINVDQLYPIYAFLRIVLRWLSCPCPFGCFKKHPAEALQKPLQTCSSLCLCKCSRSWLSQLHSLSRQLKFIKENLKHPYFRKSKCKLNLMIDNWFFSIFLDQGIKKSCKSMQFWFFKSDFDSINILKII